MHHRALHGSNISLLLLDRLIVYVALLTALTGRGTGQACCESRRLRCLTLWPLFGSYRSLYLAELDRWQLIRRQVRPIALAARFSIVNFDLD